MTTVESMELFGRYSCVLIALASLSCLLFLGICRMRDRINAGAVLALIFLSIMLFHIEQFVYALFSLAPAVLIFGGILFRALWGKSVLNRAIGILWILLVLGDVFIAAIYMKHKNALADGKDDFISCFETVKKLRFAEERYFKERRAYTASFHELSTLSRTVCESGDREYCDLFGPRKEGGCKSLKISTSERNKYQIEAISKNNNRCRICVNELDINRTSYWDCEIVENNSCPERSRRVMEN